MMISASTFPPEMLPDLAARVDEAAEAFWVGSRSRLRLNVDTLTVRRLLREIEFAEQ